MDAEAFSDGLLGLIIRLAGLFWLLGAFALVRQIRMEMMLDRMTSQIEGMTEKAARDTAEPAKSAEDAAIERWKDRDDAARRGWIAGQAVVLIATALAMILLHPLAVWLVALLVAGQGLYFFWREWTARRAPNAEASTHARPTRATVNAGWASLVVAMLVWSASFRGVLG
jgi:Flp pilus assembly protein TadB